MKASCQKKIFLIVMQAAITVVFLYLTFHQVKFSSLKKVFLSVNYELLLLTLLPQLIAVFLLAIREKYLLIKLYPFQFRDLIEATVIGFIGNNILPLRSGEFLKALFWSRQSNQPYLSLLSVAMIERMLDLVFLVMLFFVGSQTVLLKIGFNVHWILLLTLFIFVICGFFIFMNRKCSNEFTLHASLQAILGKKISDSVSDYFKKIMMGFKILGSAKHIGLAFFITILYWGMNISGLLIAFLAFHLPVSWQCIIVLLLATCFGTAIPAAPGYIGTFDYFTKIALTIYGVNSSVAVSFAIATHFMSIVPLTVVGIIFVYPVLGKLLKSKNKLI